MKRTFYPFLVAGLVAACQQQKPATTLTVTTPPVAASDSTSKQMLVPSAEAPLPTMFGAADTLTRPMRELLRTHDFSALWRNLGDGRDQPAFEGFFGPDHYHFGMAFTQVTRDLNNPAVYHVLGKCRYRKNIRPFSGLLTVRRITGLSYPGFLQAKALADNQAADSVAGRTYTAHAQLQLREEQKENSGIFEGEVLLDFYTVPGQQPNFVTVFDHEGIDERFPTRGSGLLLRGKRRNISTGQVKSFAVGPWVSAVAPDVFKDFMLDERMGEINPKYAKLGWNEYWNNDEWWADSPKPKLNL
jgi:hypothetical protein